MPTYTIEGKKFNSPRELSIDELEQVASTFRAQAAVEKTPISSSFPIVGSIVAPAAAAALTGPVSLPVGVGAAMLGGGTGEAVRQMFEGEQLDPAQVGREAALSGAGEGFGRVIAGALPTLVSGTKRALGLETQSAKEAIPLAERQASQEFAQQAGTTIPASRISGNVSQALEGLSRAGLGEGGFAAANKQFGEAMRAQVDDIVSSSVTNAMDDISLGHGMKTAFDNAVDAVQQNTSKFYRDTLPEQGGTFLVYLSNTANKAKKTLDDARKLSRSGTKTPGMDEETVKLYQDIADLRTGVTFDKAHQLRSQLLKRQRALSDKYGANSVYAKELNGVLADINKQMDLAAEALNPELKRAYRAVNNKYKRTMADLYDDVVVKALQKTPERVGEGIAKTGNVTEVLKVRKAIQRAKIEGQPVKDLEENLLSGYLQNLTKGVTDDPVTLVRLADKLETDKAFKRTFDTMMQMNPTVKNNLYKVMNAAKIATRDNAPTILQGRMGAGGVTGALSAMGAGGSAMTGSAVPALVTGGILATQGVLARILTSAPATNALLAAEKIANKQGINAALKFIRNSKPLSRFLGQETARGPVGPQIP